MVDDSLNYPLAPLGLLIQDSPHHTSHSVIGWTDFFVFYFLFFVLNPRIHGPQPVRYLCSSPRRSCNRTSDPPQTLLGPIRRAGSLCSRCFPLATSLYSIRYLRAHPNGRRFNPLPNSARAARCISFLLFSAPPSLHLGPLVRCKPPPGFDELNGVVVVMTVNLF